MREQNALWSDSCKSDQKPIKFAFFSKVFIDKYTQMI